MGRIGEIVDEATALQLKHLRPGAGISAVRATVGSAAGVAARRVAREYLDPKLSIEGRADMLGVTVKRNFSDVSYRSKYVSQTISAEERNLYGYGDIRDDLIRDVKQAIGDVIPEHTTRGPAYKLAGRTIHIVSEKPEITAFELDDRLTKINEQMPLFAAGCVLPRDVIMGFSSVPAIARDVTIDFLASGHPIMRAQSEALGVAHG